MLINYKNLHLIGGLYLLLLIEVFADVDTLCYYGTGFKSVPGPHTTDLEADEDAKCD